MRIHQPEFRELVDSQWTIGQTVLLPCGQVTAAKCYNSFMKSLKSISQKSEFYRRVVLRFEYTMRNQYGMFGYSLYRDYEWKI